MWACTLGVLPWLDKENQTFSCPEDVLMVLSFFFSAVIRAAECVPTALRGAQCALIPATCSVVGPHVAVFGMRGPDSGPVRRI